MELAREPLAGMAPIPINLRCPNPSPTSRGSPFNLYRACQCNSREIPISRPHLANCRQIRQSLQFLANRQRASHQLPDSRRLQDCPLTLRIQPRLRRLRYHCLRECRRTRVLNQSREPAAKVSGRVRPRMAGARASKARPILSRTFSPRRGSLPLQFPDSLQEIPEASQGWAAPPKAKEFT